MSGDYIGWGIGLLGILITIILAKKNKRLKDERRIVNTTAKNIQQVINNPVYNLPNEIKDEFELIITHSGSSAIITTVKTTKRRNK